MEKRKEVEGWRSTKEAITGIWSLLGILLGIKKYGQKRGVTLSRNPSELFGSGG